MAGWPAVGRTSVESRASRYRRPDGRPPPCNPRRGGIGRDRLDPQQGEQPLQSVVEIGIDAIEDRLKLRVGHLYLSYPWLSGSLAYACSPTAVGDKAAAAAGGCRICQTSPAASRTAGGEIVAPGLQIVRKDRQRQERQSPRDRKGRPGACPDRYARIIGGAMDQHGDRKEQPHEIILSGQRRRHGHQAEQNSELFGVRPWCHPRGAKA